MGASLVQARIPVRYIRPKSDQNDSKRLVASRTETRPCSTLRSPSHTRRPSSAGRGSSARRRRPGSARPLPSISDRHRPCGRRTRRSAGRSGRSVRSGSEVLPCRPRPRRYFSGNPIFLGPEGMPTPARVRIPTARGGLPSCRTTERQPGQSDRTHRPQRG